MLLLNIHMKHYTEAILIEKVSFYQKKKILW